MLPSGLKSTSRVIFTFRVAFIASSTFSLRAKQKNFFQSSLYFSYGDIGIVGHFTTPYVHMLFSFSPELSKASTSTVACEAQARPPKAE